MNAENFYVVQDTNVVADAQSMFEVEFDRLEDAEISARQANRQLADGERWNDVCQRLRNWAHDLRIEDAAADAEHAQYDD